jgi:hypothetical protein
MAGAAEPQEALVLLGLLRFHITTLAISFLDALLRGVQFVIKT